MRSLISGLWVSFAMAGRGFGQLLPRAYQTSAICNSSSSEDWLWMDNVQSKSPCLTAAFTSGPCSASNYIIPALGPDNKSYTSPAGSFVTPCGCSWATYNLLSACTVCQGFPTGVRSWADWSQNCAGDLDLNRPYPVNFTIPDKVTFPNFAAMDPHNWTDGRFDVDQAKQFQAANPGDWQDPQSAASATPSSTPASNHSASVGAIAGGVVGGVLVLGIGVAIALFLLCRNRRLNGQKSAPQDAMVQNPFSQHHARSPSDNTNATGFAYHPIHHTPSPSAGSTGLLLPQSPTSFHTHNTSMGSISPEPSILMSMGYPVTPPPHSGTNPNMFPAPHGTVSPFTLERPSSSQETPSGHEKKRSDLSGQFGEGGGLSSVLGQTRMNPPAYSEDPNGRGDFGSQAPDQASTYNSTSIVTTPSSRRPHEKSLSIGSMGSSSSSIGLGIWAPANLASFSGVADHIMDSNGASGPSGATPAYTGPGPNVNVPRDEKRRPTIMNQTPADRDQSAPQ